MDGSSFMNVAVGSAILFYTGLAGKLVTWLTSPDEYEDREVSEDSALEEGANWGFFVSITPKQTMYE